MSRKELVRLNEVVSNITEFSITRTRDNLKRPIFIIYSSNEKNIKNIVEYLSIWISKPIKKLSVDMLDTFQEEKINKEHLYVFNMTKNKILEEESKLLNVNVSDVITNNIYNVLIDKAGPMIFIADNRHSIPTIFTSIHSSIFIDDIKGWNLLINLNKEYEYEKEDILVIDDMNSFSKISVLKEF
jgi:uncharacterized ubiquitin-like protein YukD